MPTRLQSLIQTRRVESDDLIIMDGATGTELIRRGFDVDPSPLWSGAAVESAVGRKMLSAIHSDYAKAGADVVTAATFRLNPRRLAQLGRSADGERLIQYAVALAKDAAPECVVAGSLAPAEDCWQPEAAPQTDALVAEHGEMIDRLMGAGCDIILAETLGTLREVAAVLQALESRQAAAILSLTTRADATLLSGERLDEAVGMVNRFSAPERLLATCVNCVAVSEMMPSLEILRGYALSDVGFYPNMGSLDQAGVWRVDHPENPDMLADVAQFWVYRGFRYVGGCCGSTPAHTRAVAERWGRLA